MQCFAARQIGATDFCTQTLRGRADVAARPGRGVRAGQRPAEGVQPRGRQGPGRRTPTAPATTPSSAACAPTCCNSDGNDEGVCITMRTCTQNVDCRDPVRSVCAATFLQRALLAEHDPARRQPLLSAGGLRRQQDVMLARRDLPAQGRSRRPPTRPTSACPTAIRRAAARPTTSACAQISGPANPAVCIPGLLGFVCNTDVDCLLGTCKDDGGTGAGHGDS